MSRLQRGLNNLSHTGNSLTGASRLGDAIQRIHDANWDERR